MASNLVGMASNLEAMASNLLAMASNLVGSLQPTSDGFSLHKGPSLAQVAGEGLSVRV